MQTYRSILDISSCFIIINHTCIRKGSETGEKYIYYEFSPSFKKKSISFQLQRIPELSKRSLISEIKNNIFIHRQPFLHFLIATANIVRWILNHRKNIRRWMKAVNENSMFAQKYFRRGCFNVNVSFYRIENNLTFFNP